MFGNVDSYGDIVVKGAFSNTLSDWEASGNPIPLLFGHNMTDPDYNIGHVVSAEEDEIGLKVTAQLDLENPKAKQTYRMLKGRRINQMSFAYDVVDGQYVKGNNPDDDEDPTDEVYEIRKLKLYEVSVVTVGANQETEILAVKSLPSVAERLMADVKAGRVLSAKNEGMIRTAHDALTQVLSALDGTTDEQKASEPGPSCQQDDDIATKSDQDQTVSEEPAREANPTSSVDRSACIDAMLGAIYAEVA